MMEPEAMLPEELLWATGGHASDIVLTALADGEQAIVPPAVRAHVQQCTACTMHLGHAALLALYTQSELAARHQHDALRRPLPRLPIALGLLAALVGLVPSLGDLEPAAFLHEMRLYLEGIGTLTRRAGSSTGAVGILVPWVVATLLVGLGFAIVARFPASTKDHAS